jgi:undecaprenyl-diphosphatase
MAASAAALWVADRQAESGARERPDHVTSQDVRAASLAQVAALAPGVSRTGITLTALRARGVDREQALRTSLLMSLAVTVGAAGLTAVRGRARPPLVPSALAAGTAYAAARRVPSARRVVAASVAYRLVVAAAVPVVARARRRRSPL